MEDFFKVKMSGRSYEWSNDQIAYARAQKKLGKSNAEIAEQFGVSTTTIINLLAGQKKKESLSKKDPTTTKKKRTKVLSCCPICGKALLGNDVVRFKGDQLHLDCFNQTYSNNIDIIDERKQERAEVKEQKELAEIHESLEKFSVKQLKDGMSEEEFKDKKNFLEYLQSLGVEVGVKVLAISDKYIAQYGMTWDTMRQTLVYLHEIKCKELIGDIIGIIPYYHAEAQHFFYEVEQVKDANQGADMSNMYRKTVVHIKKPKRKIKQIDIDAIVTEEDTYE